MQQFQYEQQGLWTFLISHVSKMVLHHIQLDVTFSDIDRNKDTYDLWALLKKSALTKGTYNLQNLRNEWANFKQYTLDEASHVVSLIPLREYLNKFKDIVDSVRYQVAIFNFGLQPKNLTYNDVKTQLLYLDQLNRSLYLTSSDEYRDIIYQ